MSEKNGSNAVGRALSMLELIAESSHGLSNSDLSRRLKIPKSSASYILRA
jgi:DNA-binding IclR family transcriptional regulator